MLYFSRGQRNGLIVLSFLIVVSAVSPFFIKYLKKDYDSSFLEFEKEIEQARKQEKQSFSEETQVELFEFDPNIANEQDFIRLGLSSKQIKQILNYRNKKGRFYKKEDFAKIYAIDENTYSRLESYIVIPKQGIGTKKRKLQTKKHKQAPLKYKKVIVEINSVSVDELQKVRGIAETFSKRIIKYRDALGGFFKKSQLKEVYGIDEEKYLQIQDQITCNGTTVKRIRVNFSTAKDIEKHPYFSKKQANKIMKNKTFKGRYKSIEDFKNRLGFSDEFIDKVRDYLEF